MKLDRRLQDGADLAVEKASSRLYFVAMREAREQAKKCRSGEHFNLQWASVAPSGNIYRYNGLTAERRKHIEDLQAQLAELADEHAQLLGGPGVPRQERVRALVRALEQAPVTEPPGAEPEENALSGFHPLLEFVSDEVWRCGPILTPADPQEFSHWRKAMIISTFVFGIQVLAPVLVFMNRWNMRTNYLASWEVLQHKLSWSEIMCFAGHVKQPLNILMGVFLIVLIIYMVRLYVSEEMDNAERSVRMPTDVSWFILGVTANLWCCVVTVMCIPLLFWSESTPTNIVLDSMTLLFVFRLDDLTEALGGGLYKCTDDDFRRILAWHMAMLSQCPVRVRDLIDAQAKSADGLWRIRFSNAGRLLAASSTDSEPVTCETRIMSAVASEKQPLLKSKTAARLLSPPGLVRDTSTTERLRSPEAKKIRYHVTASGCVELPCWRHKFMQWLWWLVAWLLLILQFIVPFFWAIVHKSCNK